MYSLNTLKIASSFFIFLPLIRPSTWVLNSINCFATIAFNTVIGFAQFAVEPTALNSNLFPVKANGEVRFLSVLSNKISGILPTTFNFNSVLSSGDNLPSFTFSKAFNTFVNCVPIKTEIIAGGASLAPKRWSLLAPAIAALNSSSYSFTALMVFIKKVKNCKFFIGVLPGLNRLTPVLVAKDQLLCFPLPFIPANGFSWNNTLKLCLSATLVITSISSEL